MRALIWSFRLLVFLAFFAFAAKNTEPVTLRLFFGGSWQVPLIILVFGFFAAGALLGVLAMTAPFATQWREKRQLAGKVSRQSVERPLVQPPSAEG
jgi:lipopolysaccharide assembly protein A